MMEESREITEPSSGQEDDPQEKHSGLRRVHDRKPRVDIVAGRLPVYEALRAGTLLEKIVILFGVKGDQIEKIRTLAKKNNIPVVEVGKQKFRDLVSDTTTQGVVAIVGTKRYVDVDDILKLAKDRGEPPFVLVLDEIQDPQNLGALIRTAECAGMHGVIIPKHHSAAVNQTVAKTSAGASEHMYVAKVTNIAQCLEELKKQGLWIVGTDSQAEKPFTAVDYSGPLAVVIGNEGSGIRKLVKEKCDFVVKIPLFGKVQSLNASVAGALVMYEAVKRRQDPGKR
jgi:23S rRNA (guanosine2251-2'-O)-methyltransferase